MTYLIRYAREDQYPQGTDLRQKARDSVIRYCTHFSLQFRWLHDQGVEMWRWSNAQQKYYPTGIHGYRSEVEILN